MTLVKESVGSICDS